MKLFELTISDDSGVKTETDDDLDYLKSQKRRYENMGMVCKIVEVKNV